MTRSFIISSNVSTTSASISSKVPNTEKVRRRRRSAFIVSRRLEPLIKYEAQQLVNIASQKNILNRAHLIDLMNLCSLHENMKS